MLKFNAILIAFFVSVSFLSNGQSRTLRPEKIGKLLPTKIKGYYATEAKNSLIELGTLRYSLAERTFAKGKKNVKILLFDYGEAPVMFNQAIRKWGQMTPIENDSVIYRPLAGADSSAWESYSIPVARGQLIVGVNKRFFLTLNSEKLALEELRQILLQFPFDKYPK